MEWVTFGPWLQRSRCAFLERMKNHRRALIFGDGDGRFTARLLRTNQQVNVDAVDGSAAMLRSLKRRAGEYGARVRTIETDARAWTPDRGGAQEKYDLVVTHFFLDCLTTAEVVDLAEAVRPAVSEKAAWVLSEFAIPRGVFGLMVARPLVRALYWAFGWLTGLDVRRLPDYHSALEGAGFHCADRQRRLGGLLVSDWWVSQGETGAPSITPNGPPPGS